MDEQTRNYVKRLAAGQMQPVEDNYIPAILAIMALELEEIRAAITEKEAP